MTDLLGVILFIFIGSVAMAKIFRKLHEENDNQIKEPQVIQNFFFLLIIISVLQIAELNFMTATLLCAIIFASVNAWNDWQEQAVFDVLTIGMLIFAIIYALVNQVAFSQLILLGCGLFAIGVIGIKSGIIRSGDCLFLVACGILVGSNNIVLLLIYAACGGGLYGFWLLFQKKLSWETTIPFTPWLLMATIILLMNT